MGARTGHHCLPSGIARGLVAVAWALCAFPASAQDPGMVDRREAARRLAQAQRELARGPDMQHGIPPAAERNPGDRRRARVVFLQRNVEAARARTRELSAPGIASGAPLPPKNGV